MIHAPDFTDPTLTSRLYLSILAGIMDLFFGIFALNQGRNNPMNRWFAAFNFALAPWNLVGLLFVVIPEAYRTIPYRLIQLCGPIGMYCVLRFTLAFSSSKPNFKIPTWISWILLAAAIPLYASPLIVASATAQGGKILRVPGPLYGLNALLTLGFLISGLSVSVRNMLKAQGTRRRQARLIAFGFSMGLFAIVARIASINGMDVPWLYFSIQIVTSLIWAYSISMYQMLDFGTTMRRIAILSAVYIPLISIPSFVFFPFRAHVAALGPNLWIFLTTFCFFYASLFAFAPALTSYLQLKDEQRRQARLRHQLSMIGKAAEKMADESSLSLNDICDRMTHVLHEYYWDLLKTPLSFAAVVLRDRKGAVAWRAVPENAIDESFLRDLLEKLGPSKSMVTAKELPIMELNGVELAFPSVHDGKLLGAVVLGRRETSFFSEEETAAVQMATSHMATAVRKSELLERTRELDDLDKLKKDLITNITHEFKSPLGNVENSIDLVIDQIEQMPVEEAREFLNIAKSNVGRLATFIQNLLEVAKLDRPKIDLRLADCNMAGIVREVVELLKPTMEKKKLIVVVEGPDHIDTMIDPEKMTQVFYNLISNAVKFTEKGSITVRMQEETSTIRVDVIDTGAGIPEAHLKTVFDRFFQVPDPNASHFHGTGLGLAIVKGWVEAHGGRVWAESEGRGKGSRFIVELPKETE